MPSSACVLSSISRKGYAAAGRISSFNLYWIQFISPSSLSSSNRVSSNNPKPPPPLNNYILTRGVHTKSGRIPSPWLMLPSTLKAKADYKFYRLADEQVVRFDNKTNGGEIIQSKSSKRRRAEKIRALVGSSHGWLAFFDRIYETVFLTDPVSGRNIKLPPIDTLVISKRNGMLINGTVTSVVISGSPDNQEEECRAMMIYAWDNMLAFCCPGHSLEWTPIGNVYGYADQKTIKRRSYESVVYSSRQKLFFCVRESLGFEAWDLSDPRSPRRVSMDDVKVDDDGKSFLAFQNQDDIKHRQFLVIADHSDELFLVRQFVTFTKERGTIEWGTIGFDVHRYDPVARVFKYIDTGGVCEYDAESKALKYTTGGSGGSSLDGLALFVGANHGFALPADEYPKLRPNSIYFTDRQYARELCQESIPIWFSYDFGYGNHNDNDDEEEEEENEEKSDFGGHDVGIFNYEDGTFSPCYPSDYPTIKNIRTAPTWFTPNPHL